MTYRLVNLKKVSIFAARFPLTERERTNTVSVREWHRLMVVEY